MKGLLFSGVIAGAMFSALAQTDVKTNTGFQEPTLGPGGVMVFSESNVPTRNAKPDDTIQTPVDVPVAPLGLANLSRQAPFTVIQLPDEQYAFSTNTGGNSNARSSAMIKTITWITNNAVRLNLKAVIMPGDLVNTATFANEWVGITNQMGRLRSAGIAVFPSPGNHDDQGGTNAYLMYNQYISDIVKSSRTFTGDRLYPDDYTDVCFTNTWNGVNVLVVTLRDTFSADQAAWAQQMAAKYPAYNVIAVMHEYLNGNGELGRETDPYFYAAHGEAYWQYFERIPNLIQVMCGHLWQNDGKGALTGAQWWRHISIGDSGNVVNEMLFDTQANPGGLGGVDFVRLYRWEPALNRIQASTYVTSTSAYVHTNEADFQMAVSALRKLK